jgi:hypothetical protein
VVLLVPLRDACVFSRDWIARTVEDQRVAIVLAVVGVGEEQ